MHRIVVRPYGQQFADLEMFLTVHKSTITHTAEALNRGSIAADGVVMN
jgi:hypothetical protein